MVRDVATRQCRTVITLIIWWMEFSIIPTATIAIITALSKSLAL
jgi:hypothetical protein